MISVIVNVYNGEKYIKKCLDSIINQTYKDLEILIVDDGSTDNTLKICKKIKDKRIRIISQKNIGISLSRNVGLDNVKGDYVFFVDSDDFIEKDTIEYLYNLCIKYDVPISICQSIEVFDYDFTCKQPKEKIDLVHGIEVVKKILLNVERNGSVWGKLMRRDVATKYRFQDRKISDVVVIYKMLMDIDKLAYSNQIKYYYYQRKDSIVNSHTTKWSMDYYKGMLERYEDIKKRYPDMIENDICVLWSIMSQYSHNDKELDKFLEKEEARKLFKEKFTLKVLTSNLKRRDKYRIMLYAISPKLYRFILKKYLKRKKKKVIR